MAFNMHCARPGNDSWIMDSGATCHVCPHRDWFTDFVETSEKMYVADGRAMEVKGKGSIIVWTEMSNGRLKVPIQDVRFVPVARCCLFSLPSIEEQGYEVRFKEGKCMIVMQDRLCAAGRKVGRLYRMDLLLVRETCYAAQHDVSLETWHRRLGHVNMKKVQRTLGLKSKAAPLKGCKGCIYGKMHRVLL